MTRLPIAHDIPDEIYNDAVSTRTEQGCAILAWAITVINAYSRLEVLSRPPCRPDRPSNRYAWARETAAHAASLVLGMGVAHTAAGLYVIDLLEHRPEWAHRVGATGGFANLRRASETPAFASRCVDTRMADYRIGSVDDHEGRDRERRHPR